MNEDLVIEIEEVKLNGSPSREGGEMGSSSASNDRRQALNERRQAYMTANGGRDISRQARVLPLDMDNMPTIVNNQYVEFDTNRIKADLQGMPNDSNTLYRLYPMSDGTYDLRRMPSSWARPMDDGSVYFKKEGGQIVMQMSGGDIKTGSDQSMARLAGNEQNNNGRNGQNADARNGQRRPNVSATLGRSSDPSSPHLTRGQEVGTHANRNSGISRLGAMVSRVFSRRR